MNGKEGISDSTRRLILETAKKLGYAEVPGRRALNIALLFRTGLNEFDQLFYSEMNTSLIAACRTLPYNLIMASVYHDGEEIRFFRRFRYFCGHYIVSAAVVSIAYESAVAETVAVDRVARRIAVFGPYVSPL